jgi:hypothetical protein
MSAAAQPNGGTSRQTKSLALRIHDFEVAFHADISIVIDDDFC